ncbi:MAG: YjjI family glycine radical enzyme [Atopobiaceae bacterium]|nr:YjjI family glycine radical enzyme [Atopobiaceae bacterium]
MSEFMDIITASNLTYQQKLIHLAQAAENCEHPIQTTPEFDRFFEADALCDMHEGNAPYRARYICADFERFARQGSDFLRLDAPDSLDDLLVNLEILYENIPSVTGRPVYCGQLDRIIDPFITNMDDDEVRPRLRRFLNFIDRTVASGYCHANIGPEPTRAGRLLLEVDAEVQNAVPNFTLKYDPAITDDKFMRLALTTSTACANPAYANDRLLRDIYAKPEESYRDGYTIVSCYNVLPLRGGAYCLDRVKLQNLASMATSTEHFLNELIPEACGALLEYMNARIRFLVEESNFFQSSFLVREGLIERERFCGMFGVIGMHECVERLLGPGHVYGSDDEANELADVIMQKVSEQVNAFDAVYSEIGNGRFMLHAQAGFGDQLESTPGVRIRVGEEPELFFDHLRHSARMHRFFTAGVSDIFPVEPTASQNPDALLDVVKGAFALDDKYLSFYASDSDLVRITGFLVKRSEMEKYACGEAVLADTSHDGEGNWRANALADRKVRMGEMILA